MANKEHLTEDGLIKIVSLKKNKKKMNGNGLSDKLNKNYLIIPMTRPVRK